MAPHGSDLGQNEGPRLSVVDGDCKNLLSHTAETPCQGRLRGGERGDAGE
jgi:hypothetical protein